MSEEQQELLKEKLKTFFDEKLDSLQNKFETDINNIETMKYDYFDNIIIEFREIKEKEGKAKEEEKEKKEEKGKKEEKEKKEEPNKIKHLKPLSAKETENMTKTPLRIRKTKDIGFKDKTEVFTGKKTKNIAGKKSHPVNTETEQKPHPQKEKAKKPNVTATHETKKTGANRPSKTPMNKRGRNTEDEKLPTQRTKNVKGTAAKTIATKKFTNKGKAGDKKPKKEIKKVEVEKEDEKEEPIEEKKEIILKDKTIIKIPDELKDNIDDNKNLFTIYAVLKGKYLTNQEKYNLILYNPTIYKSFGGDIKFLLEDKKNEIKSKINELESFLNNYGDLENYISKEFAPSKTAQNSLLFVKRDEIEKIIKSGNIQKEINNIFKILFYIFDIPFDEDLKDEELLNYFVSEVFDKNDIKDLKSLESNYFANHKDLNISREKCEKINAIISSDEKVISSVDIAKICRNISYCTLLIRECHEYLNIKTLDGVPIYELKEKYKLLQEYKNELAKMENNPQKEEEPQEEKETE